MKYHPYANLFPLMEGAELKSLADDIKINGLRSPIITFEDKILDGRNRLAACKMMDIEPHFREHKHGDPLAFVISANLSRRHLTESQRAAVAAELANLSNGETKKTSSANLPTSQGEAAKMLNVSTRSVGAASKVKTEAPEKFTEVQAGTKTVNRAVSEIKAKEEKKPKQGRETWGPKDRKAASAALGKFIRIVDKAPFWGDIRGLVDAIAKELKR